MIHKQEKSKHGWSHYLCTESARVINDNNLVKNIISKKILKTIPKLTISEIMDEEVNDPIDYANGNFSAKLSIINIGE